MFGKYVQSLGYESLESAMTAIEENPELMNQFPFAPGYLDLIEEWLTNCRNSRFVGTEAGRESGLHLKLPYFPVRGCPASRLFSLAASTSPANIATATTPHNPAPHNQTCRCEYQCPTNKMRE